MKKVILCLFFLICVQGYFLEGADIKVEIIPLGMPEWRSMPDMMGVNLMPIGKAQRVLQKILSSRPNTVTTRTYFLATLNQKPESKREWKPKDPSFNWKVDPGDDYLISKVIDCSPDTMQSLLILDVKPGHANMGGLGRDWTAIVEVTIDWEEIPENISDPEKKDIKPDPIVIESDPAIITLPHFSIESPTEARLNESISQNTSNQKSYSNINKMDVEIKINVLPAEGEITDNLKSHFKEVLWNGSMIPSDVYSLDKSGKNKLSSKKSGTAILLSFVKDQLPFTNNEFDWTGLTVNYFPRIRISYYTGIYSFFPPENSSFTGVPNWFYYWKQVDGDDIKGFHHAAYAAGDAALQMILGEHITPVDHIFLYNTIITKSKDNKSATPNEILKGIDLYTETLRHEEQHRLFFRECSIEEYRCHECGEIVDEEHSSYCDEESYETLYIYIPDDDIDGDLVCSSTENGYGSDDTDTASLYKGNSIYINSIDAPVEIDDNEVLTRYLVDRIFRIKNIHSSHHLKDWSINGKQWLKGDNKCSCPSVQNSSAAIRQKSSVPPLTASKSAADADNQKEKAKRRGTIRDKKGNIIPFP